MGEVVRLSDLLEQQRLEQDQQLLSWLRQQSQRAQDQQLLAVNGLFKTAYGENLIRHVFLSIEPVSVAKQWYVDGKIDVTVFEQLLDAVILGKGCEAAVHCPRCGALVKGIGPADNGLIAVRCTNSAVCHFVGYTE